MKNIFKWFLSALAPTILTASYSVLIFRSSDNDMNLPHLMILLISALMIYLITEELIYILKGYYINLYRPTPASAQDLIRKHHDTIKIAIIIPSCNEPFETAKMTFESACDLDASKNSLQVIVVDNSDSEWRDLKLWREHIETYKNEKLIDGKATFIHRTTRSGYKPANLDLALKEVNAEYVLFLDVDSTLKPDTLNKVVYDLENNPNIAFIQLLMLPTNAKMPAPLANIHGIYSSGLRKTLLASMADSYALFQGHNAIWRKDVVDKIGPILEYQRGKVVLAEDMSMTIRAAQKGFTGIGTWYESGEWVPISLKETESMWSRWNIGTLQVVAKHLCSIDKISSLPKAHILGWARHINNYFTAAIFPVALTLTIFFELYLLFPYLLASLSPYALHLILSTYKGEKNSQEFLYRLKQSYKAYFILSSFIFWVGFKSTISFIFNKKVFWIPTRKKLDNPSSITEAISNHPDIILSSTIAILYCALNLFLSTDVKSATIHALGIFWFTNLLLSINTFRLKTDTKDIKKSDYKISSGYIERI